MRNATMGSLSAPQASGEDPIISTRMATTLIASPSWSDLTPPGGMDLGQPTERSARSRARLADSVVVGVGASLPAGVGRHSDSRSGHELAVFDPAVPDLALLLLGLREGVQAIILDPRHEPLAQIAAAAAERPGLAALHIIAHGAPGEIRLGGQAVTAATLAAAGPTLQGLGGALAANGHIALWSCETGAGPEGATFREALARQTGAAVGASARPIGAGAAWRLDVGATATAPIGAAAAAGYAGVLALAITGATDDVGPILGNITEGGWTNDTTPTFFGTLPTITHANTLLVLHTGQYGSYTVGAFQPGATTWSFTLTQPMFAGETYMFLWLINPTTGTTQSPFYRINLDTTAPTATPGITAISANDRYVYDLTGDIAPGGTSNGNSPFLTGSISGTRAVGDQLAVYDGATRLGFANIFNGQGDWAFTSPVLAEGTHALTIRIEDLAGNVGPNVAARTIIVDTLTINGTADADTLTGGIGNNTLNGGDGNDYLDGGAGDDSLAGGNGDDALIGGAGHNTLNGGTGSDVVYYSVPSTTQALNLVASTTAFTGANGAGGTDSLIGIEGITAGIFNDAIDASSYTVGQIYLYGSTGNDSLTGTAFNDYLDGEDGSDTLSGGGGADILLGGTGHDSLLGGNGNDTLVGGAGNDTLSGGGDVDTADYRTGTANLTANLATGVATDGLGGTDSLNGMDNLIGGTGNDLLTGDGNGNLLNGGTGNDTLVGGVGSDTLIGGSGTDLADHSANTSAQAIVANLAAGTISDGMSGGTDSVTGIENITGGAGSDRLTGDGNANLLTGGAGNDTLVGGAGNDTLNGGGDVDTADYSSATANLTANLSTGVATDGLGGTDCLSGVDNLIGGGGNDLLTGDGNGNVLNGGSGNDVLVGGVGSDTLIGGAGDDLADYSGNTSAQAIVANLATGTVIDGLSGGTDSVTTVENVTGGAGNDRLTGDSNANLLTGGAGNDTISGGAGHDTLVGGAGNDSISGGDGTDTAFFDRAAANYTITYDSATRLLTVVGDGIDTVARDVETLNFAGTAISTTSLINTAPVITSSATAAFAEGGTGAAYEAAATDDEGVSLTWLLSGTDAAEFNINATSGAVTFRSAPNFEAPADSGADNVYD
ncbi:MAG: DUF4347 domain-containing protein, partial [Roseococcus sp.]|nr:DUF4347 domain-containing protein [Roseococcus sp.]